MTALDTKLSRSAELYRLTIKAYCQHITIDESTNDKEYTWEVPVTWI